jgi:exodeoxyribonuclease V alpha subunit
MNATVSDKAIAEEVSGSIERVTFHNDENGFCVLRVKVRGHRDEVTVLGSLRFPLILPVAAAHRVEQLL